MNAQTKHTPGPWEIYESPAGHAVCDMIVDSDGKRICEFPYGWNAKDIGGGADARLIAAAPELLDALKDILRIATAASIGVSGNAPRLERARAVIAKATGEQP